MSKPLPLNQVTDRFDLTNEGRMDGNKRNYIIKAVQSMFEGTKFKQGVRLGEHYGYFGHGRRQLTGKLSPSEVEVVMLEGKPVVINNVPSNTCAFAECTDQGIVTHTENILKTDTGKIVNGMIESAAGGWSWATGGRDSQAQSVTRSFHGFDYVTNPNFISLDRPSMMMESAAGHEGLNVALGRAFSSADVDNITEVIDRLRTGSDVDRLEHLESEVFMLEGVISELDYKQQEYKDAEEIMRADILEGKNIEKTRQAMLEGALQSSPFFMTKEQKAALSSMKTEEDGKIIAAMFESFSRAEAGSLPNLPLDAPLYVQPPKKVSGGASPTAPNYEKKKVRLFR